MKRLNINIHDDIYQDLQHSAQENGQSKTYIVEKALRQYFEQSTDKSTSMQIEPSNLDNLEDGNYRDRASEEIEQLKERINLLENNQRKQDERLDNAVSPSMLDERLAMATEPIWETLTLETEKRDHQESQPHLDFEHGLSQKELAERWDISSRAISDAKKKDQADWENYSKKYDPDGLIWHLSGRKYYPQKQC